MHLAYKTNYNKLKETRSVDGGNNWTAPATITTDADGVVDEFSITASGEHVYIVYADQNVFHPRWGSMRYRHSPDSGATWEAERNLTPKKWKTSHPDVELYDGTLRVTYGRKTESGLTVWYQESADGLVWSTPEVVEFDRARPAPDLRGQRDRALRGWHRRRLRPNRHLTGSGS